MHNVYRYSFMCISALSATDDDGGCFFTRDIEVVKPSILNFSKDGVSQPTLYTSYRHDYCAWQEAFSQEVLTSRAWVLQERLLAPRTLTLGKTRFIGNATRNIGAKPNQSTSGGTTSLLSAQTSSMPLSFRLRGSP